MGYGRSPCHRRSRKCPAHRTQHPIASGLRSGRRVKSHRRVSEALHGNMAAAWHGQHHRRAATARLMIGLLPAQEVNTNWELYRALGARRQRRPAFAAWNAAQPVPQGLSDSEHARQRPHAAAWGLPFGEIQMLDRRFQYRKKTLHRDAEAASKCSQDGGELER